MKVLLLAVYLLWTWVPALFAFKLDTTHSVCRQKRLSSTFSGSPLEMSLINTRKRRCESTPPCGMPHLNMLNLLLNLNLIFLFARNDLRHFSRHLAMLISLIFYTRPSCQTRSRALEKSIKAMTVCLGLLVVLPFRLSVCWAKLSACHLSNFSQHVSVSVGTYDLCRILDMAAWFKRQNRMSIFKASGKGRA